jgi:beclin
MFLSLIVCYLKNCHFTIQEERDAISAKIEDSQAHLETLNRTNILNDVFYISQHGVFGTINNLRLGHTHVVGILIAKWKAKTLIHYILFEAHIEYSYLIKIYVTLILG